MSRSTSEGSRELARPDRRFRRTAGRRWSAFGRVVALSGTSPSAHAARRESAGQVADALATLKPEHAEVIRLRTMHGLDWAEVAERMNRSYDAARLLWLRAVDALRPKLEDRS